MDGYEPTGYVHSVQTLGAVDGPGIRYCVFMQGCPLRCMYCHNPDTWERTAGQNGGRVYLGTPYTVSQLADRIERYRTYFTGGGGVTVTGGEPLMQAGFVTELFAELKSRGINTCLDTSGMYTCCAGNADEARDMAGELLKVTDLVICDIKFTTEEEYHRYTGGSLDTVMEFIGMADELKVPLTVRHVVVPGYTDSPEEVSAMGRLAHRCGTLKKIELLPFHKMCSSKYEKLGIPFRCEDVPECTADTIGELYGYIG